jgi:hypothetical protein
MSASKILRLQTGFRANRLQTIQRVPRWIVIMCKRRMAWVTPNRHLENPFPGQVREHRCSRNQISFGSDSLSGNLADLVSYDWFFRLCL